MKVKIIDGICGSGKTSYAIQKINDNYKFNIEEGFGDTQRFLVVTPYLNEVERFVNSTKCEFVTPDTKSGKGSKMEHFKKLIKEEKSIVITHTLYSMIDRDTLELIETIGYTLIMDEVANVIEQENISKKDIQMLLTAKTIEIDKDGYVEWIDNEYNGKFEWLMPRAKRKSLMLHNDSFIFWTLDVKSFTAFDEVYVLTYLFDGQIQKYYYEMCSIGFEKYSVIKINDRYELIEYDAKTDNREKIKGLLDIYEDSARSKLNSNYFDNKKDENTLTSTWITKAKEENKEQLQKNLYTYFKNRCNAKVEDVFWSTKREFAPKIKNKICKFNKKDDNKHNFVPLNIRATNEYMDCTSCAYVYNRYMNPTEKQFFKSKGISVDEELLAISDLIQFIFRGCIRKGEPMNVYIPSKRMRELLYDYLEYKI